MTGRAKVLLLTTAVAIASNCYAQDLKSYRQKYEDGLQKIVADHQQRTGDITKIYSTGLNSLKARVQAAGDLDKLKSVMEEISRFQMAETLPTVEDKPISEVLTLVKDCQSNTEKADTAKAQRIVRLTAQYDKALLGLQKQHTRKGEIDNATAIQEERKALAEAESVTAANALLAKASKPSPKIKQQPAHKPTLRKPEIHIEPSDRSVTTDIAILRVGERMGNNRPYKFKQIPKELQGLNFVRMECRKPGNYDVRVQDRGLMYILVVTRPTDGSELLRSGWKKTTHTITTDTGDLLLVYEKQVSGGTFKIKSTGNRAYMLATEMPIKMSSSNK